MHSTKKIFAILFIFSMILILSCNTPENNQESSSSSILTTPPAPMQQNPQESSFTCQPLELTRGVIVTVRTSEELRSAIIKAGDESQDTTILLEDGTYPLSNSFWIEAPNLIIKSKSGMRENVILTGQNVASHIFQIAADNIIIADLTLQDVQNHAVQIHGEFDADGILLHNLHIKDTGEQMIKGSYDASKKEKGTDDGIVECSLLEYPQGIGPQYYIGGIDIHNGKNWIVRNSIFKNIRSPDLNIDLLAEHAIHFWSDSKNTVVENNLIINCDRGIGFGLGDRGHQGGIIRTNIIYHNSSFGDVGIGLENAQGTMLDNNTIYFENDYPNAIEYRFSKSKQISIQNTKTNRQIKERDGGQATLENNQINSELDPASLNIQVN